MCLLEISQSQKEVLGIDPSPRATQPLTLVAVIFRGLHQGHFSRNLPSSMQDEGRTMQRCFRFFVAQKKWVAQCNLQLVGLGWFYVGLICWLGLLVGLVCSSWGSCYYRWWFVWQMFANIHLLVREGFQFECKFYLSWNMGSLNTWDPFWGDQAMPV